MKSLLKNRYAVAAIGFAVGVLSVPAIVVTPGIGHPMYTGYVNAVIDLLSLIGL